MFDLSGMTALVTGASGGLGSAIARALAGRGARLARPFLDASKLLAGRNGRGCRRRSGGVRHFEAFWMIECPRMPAALQRSSLRAARTNLLLEEGLRGPRTLPCAPRTRYRLY